MNRRTSLAVGLAVGITAAAVAATPALAAGGAPTANDTTTCPVTGQAPLRDGTGLGAQNGRGMGGAAGQGYGMRQGAGNGTAGQGYGQGAGANGQGQGYGMNGRGQGMGAGRGGAIDLSGLTKGTLTSAQRTALASMAEEEKLAHDLYVALAAKYPSVVQFSRIANSETRHLTAVRALLTRYGIADPTAGKAAGTFASPAMQSLYDSLFASATSSSAALAAGVAVEKRDIADLTALLKGLTAPDATTVLTNLSRASQQHLRAFGG